MASVAVDSADFRAFFAKMGEAPQAFRQEAAVWLDAIGNDFLRTVEETIIRLKVMDTRLLLNSFQKGNSGNIWTLTEGDLTLEVGSSVDYAAYVEYGHKQQPGRFIPGEWKKDRFIYEPGAKTGMVLKASWVEGKHYFETALRAYEKVFHASLEKRMQGWLEKYFG